LLASVRAFSAFFALASADLVDFSALTLAVVATSKAFLEAASSASSDEMRALAAARASAVHDRRKKNQAKKQRKACKTSKYRKRNLPSEALAAFRHSTHSLPKATNFRIKFCPENRTRVSTHKSRSKRTRKFTHIVGGACGLMGLKRSTGV
jgi:hypothetical protein